MTGQASILRPDPCSDVEPGRWHTQGPVIIAGGGIGGLAAALALARRQIPSLVLERRPEFTEAGAGIQIGPNGTAILRRLGVDAALAPHVGTPGHIVVHDGRDGTVLTRLPLGAWIEQRHSSPYWVAHRQDLHAVLLDRAKAEPLIALMLDAAFQSLDRQDGEGLCVTTRDHRTFKGAALIGADGIWSSVRRALFSPDDPVGSGLSAVRATIPVDPKRAAPLQRDTYVWLRPDAHIVHYPVRGGAEIAVVCILNAPSASQDWSSSVDRGWVEPQIAAFPAEVRRLLATAPEWRRWSLFTLQPGFAISNGRTALLGDAAHPVLPFLAQGAVLALEDAVVLADALAAHADIPAGLASYARIRRDRNARVTAASRRNGRIYHLDGAMAAARNLALRGIGGERIMAGYDWLYGWRA
jgi:salicylate hydroxylase